jgi:hypothetical protein
MEVKKRGWEDRKMEGKMKSGSWVWCILLERNAPTSFSQSFPPDLGGEPFVGSGGKVLGLSFLTFFQLNNFPTS